MDTLSVTDNTTVVGGPSSAIGDADFLKKMPLPTAASNHLSTSHPGSKMFVGGADYFDTNRHFFVKIGKDGLIAALNKLDKELQEVMTRPRPDLRPR